MDLKKLDELGQKLEKAALAIELCEIELGEVREGGIDNDLEESVDIKAALAAAGKKFEEITLELKLLSEESLKSPEAR